MSKLIRPAQLPLYRRGMKFPEGISRRALIRGMTNTDQVGQQQGDRTYSFDANMALSGSGTVYAATGYAQYIGADGIVDLGGNQNATVTLLSIQDGQPGNLTPQQARIDAVCVLDVTAVVTTGTASEKVILVGSNDPAFGPGNVIQLGMMEFGAIAAQDQVNGFVTAAPPAVGGSRYEILFASEQNNVKYQYVKIYNVIANSGSITYSAFIAVLPEP